MRPRPCGDAALVDVERDIAKSRHDVQRRVPMGEKERQRMGEATAIFQKVIRPGDVLLFENDLPDLYNEK